MIDLNDLRFVGHGLRRPECVLCTRDGRLHVSDWRGGVTTLAAGGNDSRFVGGPATSQLRPNGIGLLPDGSYLIAHLGDSEGGIYRLTPEGIAEPFVMEAEGESLPPTNYVHHDETGRIWITVSTRKRPRALGYRGGDGDGFVVLFHHGAARIVADGLGYTNECVVHPDGRCLYVNETFARRLSVFDILDNGDLVNRRILTEFGRGTFPDGLCFDAEGFAWITSVVSNRVIRVGPDGRGEILLEDSVREHLDWVEDAWQSGLMGREHLDTIRSLRLRNISSLAFGGPDLKQVYLGCLGGDAIATFRSPVAGHPPAYWRYPTRRPVTTRFAEPREHPE